MHIDSTTQENFWQRVVVGENEEDCWGWTGNVGEKGARISIHAEWHGAAKIAWQLINGPIPDGARIRRRCGNPLCSNPRHAEILHESTDKDRFWERVNIIDDVDSCWEWQAARNPLGYGKVYVREAREPLPTHRVAYELENGPIPEGLIVMHTCDNPPCCRPSHLRLGTYADNTRDMVEKGRHVHGEEYSLSGLTWDDVREIRVRVSNGENQRRLAEEYGISPASVTLIKQNKTWRE